MLQLRNETPFAASVGRFPDPDGIDTLFAVVKATFTMEQAPRIVDEQPPVVAAPEHHGDPATGSLKLAPELGIAKPTADVLVVGHAYARQGRPTTAMDVSVRVGSVSSSLRVYGDRVWREGAVGYAATEPEPFVMMPLAWERSFGGSDEVDGQKYEEPRNPAGIGFRKGGGNSPIAGSPLPNLERIDRPMMAWDANPSPIGLGPVSPHWEPRRSYAGTYDDAWLRQRAPYLPADFNPFFLQCAPPELIAPTYFVGGEPVALEGLSVEGTQQFQLPHVSLTTSFVLDGTSHARPPVIDTVVLDTDRRHVSMVWRAAFPCDKRALRVSEVRVAMSSGR